MVKKKHVSHHVAKKRKHIKSAFWIKFAILVFGLIFIAIGIISTALAYFEYRYNEKVYPGVLVEGINVGGKTPKEIENYYLLKNASFEKLTITFSSSDRTATLSGMQLDLGFDVTLSAQQAYLIGRGGGSILSNIVQKIIAFQKQINLPPLFSYKENVLQSFLDEQAQFIDIPVQEALFSFQNRRVTTFKPSRKGRQLNQEKTKTQLTNSLQEIATMAQPPQSLTVDLAVETIHPTITTDKSNSFGIQELVGRGESSFWGSIPGREYNLALAASRLNGVLIAPGEVFSFNAAVGDISAATGYKQAYIIKQGRTVLDDGGGVCQVSTTLFRAALNSGLPITERWAHSYRVSYYEQGGWQPGFDATVYAPRYDLKFKNNTATHILIQSYTDLVNKKLVFELYGTKDGRVVSLSNVRTWDYRPAPPPLEQEDPTLPPGTKKQVDWAAAGIKAAFDYKVTKNGEEITSDTFFSNFTPWQAVYLIGPQN